MVRFISAFLSRFNATCMGWEGDNTMSTGSPTKMEFAVNMTCISCEKAVRESLDKINDIESLEIDVQKQSVVLTSTQPSSIIQNAIEETGMLAVLRGQGRAQHLGAAISILKNDGLIKGLVRFTQIEENKCIVDGTFNGLIPGKHGIHIHEYGDISEGYVSTGDIHNPFSSQHSDRTDDNRSVGDLGNIEVDNDGEATLRYEDNLIKVWDIIGRSVVLHDNEDDLESEDHGDAGKGIAWGIIARSSGLFQNDKKVCACSGKTLWEERDDFRRLQANQ